MKKESILLLLSFLLLLSIPTMGQEVEEKTKDRLVKVNIIPTVGIGYEQFIASKQSISLSANYFKISWLEFFLGSPRDRNSATVWLDYKLHQKDYYIGPYLKYRNSRLFTGDGGIRSQSLSIGFLAGYLYPLGRSFFLDASGGVGYRQLLNESTFDTSESLTTLKDEANQTATNIDLRLRVQLGYRF